MPWSETRSFSGWGVGVVQVEVPSRLQTLRPHIYPRRRWASRIIPHRLQRRVWSALRHSRPAPSELPQTRTRALGKSPQGRPLAKRTVLSVDDTTCWRLQDTVDTGQPPGPTKSTEQHPQPGPKPRSRPHQPPWPSRPKQHSPSQPQTHRPPRNHTPPSEPNPPPPSARRTRDPLPSPCPQERTDLSSATHSQL